MSNTPYKIKDVHKQLDKYENEFEINCCEDHDAKKRKQMLRKKKPRIKNNFWKKIKINLTYIQKMTPTMTILLILKNTISIVTNHLIMKTN